MPAPQPSFSTALIVGAGLGLGAALARLFRQNEIKVAVAARRPDRLEELRAQTGSVGFACDATIPSQVYALFEAVAAKMGEPDIVVYNAGARIRGPLAELDPANVERSLAVNAFGGFLVGREAARRMLPNGHGAILFTGASASVKGYANSAPFAMGKFALRGLAQSMARELSPKGIHVAHFVIDGAIRSASFPDSEGKPDATLDPDAIARAYLGVLRQHKSAWTSEIELRPWVELF
jgi:NAD(P)-dependent dehydrogenase (short-subunit alcohol dehydrogenase family)